jgi:hypothetical protein
MPAPYGAASAQPPDNRRLLANKKTHIDESLLPRSAEAPCQTSP